MGQSFKEVSYTYVQLDEIPAVWCLMIIRTCNSSVIEINGMAFEIFHWTLNMDDNYMLGDHLG